MLHIMNTCGQIENLFDHGVFAYDKWEKYMNAICPEAAVMLQRTVRSDPTKRTTGRNRPKRGEHNALSVRRPE